MKNIKKTLYITNENTYLHCQNDAVVVEIEGNEKIRIPASAIENIISMNNSSISTPFIKFCGEHNIELTFLSPYGKFYGKIYCGNSGNVLIRKKQYELLIKNEQLPLAKNIILGKAINSKNILKRCCRDSSIIKEKDEILNSIDIIDNNISFLHSATSVDEIRGYEGVMASAYFSCMDFMIKNKDFVFNKRTKHPAQNEFNALLSFVYILLEKHIESACNSYGLDVNCGIIHSIRPGKPSLALDLMEEFRAPLADRLCLSLVNKKQISINDFENKQGEIIIKQKAIKSILATWESRKKEEIFHPYLNEKVAIELIPYIQAQLLAQFYRNDIDEYPPFVWR